jgi:hypothetical protein
LCIRATAEPTARASASPSSPYGLDDEEEGTDNDDDDVLSPPLLVDALWA